MRRVVCFILLCLFFINSAYAALGYTEDFNQTKAVINSCYLSFRDENFGSWNSVSGEGVFMKINNLDRRFNFIPKYSYNSSFLNRTYFNNFRYNLDGQSNIPILKLKEDGKDFVYINCSLRIGNYRIYLYDWLVYSYQRGLFPTHDFNLTKTLVNSTIAGDYYSSTISSSNGKYTRSQGAVIERSDTILEYFNGNSYGTSSSELLNGQEEKRGFYPESNVYVLSYINLSGLPSGMFDTTYLMREVGATPLFTLPKLIFYVNSTTKNVKDYLLPFVRAYYFKYGGVLYKQSLISPYSSPSLYPVLMAGNLLNITAELYNPFLITLSFNQTYGNVHNTYTQWAGVGLWEESLDTGSCGNVNIPGTEIETMSEDMLFSNLVSYSLASGRLVNITSNVTIPSESTLPIVYGGMGFSNSKGTSSFSKATNFGSDIVPYLGISDLDSRVYLEGGQPTLNLTLLLYAPDNLVYFGSSYPYLPVVSLANYELIVVISKCTYSTNQFNSLSVQRLSLNPTTTLYGGQGISISKYIPIETSWKNEEGQLYASVYTVPKAGLGFFYNKTVAKLQRTPAFNPGNILYVTNTSFTVSNDHLTDRINFSLFNPLFTSKNITISLNAIDSLDNFSVCISESNLNEICDAFPLNISFTPLKIKNMGLIIKTREGVTLPEFSSLLARFNLTGSIGEFSPESSIFNINSSRSTALICESNQTSSEWVNQTSGLRNSSLTDCRKMENLCCPEGQFCEANGECSNRAVTQCDNYNNELTCLEDSLQVWKNSEYTSSCKVFSDSYDRGDGEFCANVTNCGCVWNGSVCGFQRDTDTSCTTSPLLNWGKCFTTIRLEGDCATQESVRYIRDRVWISEDHPDNLTELDMCKQTVIENSPCPTPSILLPFFSWFNFIIASLTIFVCYYFAINGKKSKK